MQGIGSRSSGTGRPSTPVLAPSQVARPGRKVRQREPGPPHFGGGPSSARPLGAGGRGGFPAVGRFWHDSCQPTKSPVLVQGSARWSFTHPCPAPPSGDRPCVDSRRWVQGSRMRLVEDKKTVLVVDDNRDNRVILSTILDSAGYRVRQASDGAEAVRHVRRGGVDVVLMDLCMPGMDGWQATRAIRADPRTVHVPVIAVTALSSHRGRPLLETGDWDG